MQVFPASLQTTELYFYNFIFKQCIVNWVVSFNNKNLGLAVSFPSLIINYSSVRHMVTETAVRMHFVYFITVVTLTIRVAKARWI